MPVGSLPPQEPSCTASPAGYHQVMASSCSSRSAHPAALEPSPSSASGCPQPLWGIRSCCQAQLASLPEDRSQFVQQLIGGRQGTAKAPNAETGKTSWVHGHSWLPGGAESMEITSNLSKGNSCLSTLNPGKSHLVPP